MSRGRMLPAVLVIALAGACGCMQQPTSRGPSRAEELEKTLKQERDLRSQSEKQVQALRSERAELMTKLEEAQNTIKGAIGGEPGAFRFVVTRVSLGWLTSSVNWDNVGGDDGIQAFMEIEDQTGDTIKRAGAFQLELYDLGHEKGEPIETWTFTPEAAAKYWSTIPSGYLFKLPYSNGTPKGGQVVLVANVKLTEGGEFQAMKTLRVHH